MKQMPRSLMAASSIALLLALGACGDREVAATDPRSDSSTQVTGQANEISQENREAESTASARSDTTAMGAGADSSAGSTPTVGEKIDDAQIVAKLKAEYANDRDISAMAIDIDSKEGMVTLSGSVPNSEARVRADQIARAMKEVKSVNNQLTVKAA